MDKYKDGTYHNFLCWGSNIYHNLITCEDKIVLPIILQKYVLNWYHVYLIHPGMDRTEAIIRQHLYWPGIRDAVLKKETNCDTWQIPKLSKIKYGTLTAKEAEEIPWKNMCWYNWELRHTEKGTKRNLNLKAVMMMVPVTGIFEIAQYNYKIAISIASLVKTMWISRYPRPIEIMYNQRS